MILGQSVRPNHLILSNAKMLRLRRLNDELFNSTELQEFRIHLGNDFKAIENSDMCMLLNEIRRNTKKSRV